MLLEMLDKKTQEGGLNHIFVKINPKNLTNRFLSQV